MRVGVVFPQVEIGQDPSAIRDYAQAVEAMGYTHVLVFDHVLGANPDRPGGWKGPYTFRHAFHEPLVLFGFLAAATRRLELVTRSVWGSRPSPSMWRRSGDSRRKRSASAVSQLERILRAVSFRDRAGPNLSLRPSFVGHGTGQPALGRSPRTE